MIAIGKGPEATPPETLADRFESSKPIWPARPPGSPPRMKTEFRPGPFFVDVLGPPFRPEFYRSTAPVTKWITAPGTDDIPQWLRKVADVDFGVNGDIVIDVEIIDGPTRGKVLLNPVDPGGPNNGDELTVEALLAHWIVVPNLARNARFNVVAEVEILPFASQLQSTGATRVDLWTTVNLDVAFGVNSASQEVEVHRAAGPRYAPVTDQPKESTVWLELSGTVTPTTNLVAVRLAARLSVQRTYAPPPQKLPVTDIKIGFGAPMARVTRLIVEGY